MKLTEQQADTLRDMADWLDLKAKEWAYDDGSFDDDYYWFVTNASLIRALVADSEATV
jgi:hypothetical protein